MKQPSYLIAIPCFDTMKTDFVLSLLGLEKPERYAYCVRTGSLVSKARDGLVSVALQNKIDRILWLDSDMVFQPDTLKRLIKDMDEGRDFVTGLYFGRRHPHQPMIYKNMSYYKDDEGRPMTAADNYADYPKDSVFEIGACGFGVCLTKTEIFQKVFESFGMSPFTILPTSGEDLSLCWRLGQLGIKMYCDSGIKAKHVGECLIDETYFVKEVD